MRRIRRRQFATGCVDKPAYLKWVESNPGELDLLARDILISVTAFFRDRDAFAALRQCVAELVGRKPPGSEIRVWVAGCASGEEAYSIAMLFADALGERIALYRIQIFATDIDDDALNVARRSVYPAASTTEGPADLLERFFRHSGNTYEADPEQAAYLAARPADRARPGPVATEPDAALWRPAAPAHGGQPRIVAPSP